jgi:putative ABC transport system permease protein
MSAIGRKAMGDLRRHRLRAVLTACTLSLALSSLAIAAIPGLMDQVMARQVVAARLYDVAVATRDLVLSPAQVSALGRLPNVDGFAASIEYPAQVTVDGQRQDGTIWGLDFASQPVDAIGVVTGTTPRPGRQLVADAGNQAAAGVATPIGGRVGVRTATGAQVYLHVSGTAHGLATSPSANNGAGGPVFYASEAIVRSLAGIRGVNYLAFRLAENSPSADKAAIAAIHDYLVSQIGAEPFVALPVTRARGDWPDRAGFDQEISFLNVITVLALLSALFLIVTTMNTLVAEQAAEIAILKTLGGRRRQIASIVLRAAALLGVIGGVVGSALGIALAYLLTSYFASSFYAVKAGFAISVPVAVASLALGPGLAVLASLPGLRRALRQPVAQTLADPRGLGHSARGHGAQGYGAGRSDWLVARARLLPGPARMGVRNTLRSRRRSVAAVAQIAVATGLAIALFAGGQSVAAFVGKGYSYFRYNIEVDASNGSALGSRAIAIAAATPGVTKVEPLLEGQVTDAGHGYAAWGLPARPLYAYRLSAGRWFSAPNRGGRVPPVVLGPGAARGTGARVGQVITLGTTAGPTRFRVIGIDTGETNAGGDMYFPLAVLQRLSGLGRTANALWLTTASTRPAAVDRVTTAVQDRLTAAGYAVSSQQLDAQEADVQSEDGAFIAIIDILGLLVVAITLIGLVNALTMSVIERTREVGVLRCLGARPWQVRRVFRAEGVVLALSGWVIGVPLAVLIARLLLLFIGHDIDASVPLVFPAVSVPVALVAMVAITRLVIRPSLRRAARIQPAAALRYE